MDDSSTSWQRSGLEPGSINYYLDVLRPWVRSHYVMSTSEYISLTFLYKLDESARTSKSKNLQILQLYLIDRESEIY